MSVRVDRVQDLEGEIAGTYKSTAARSETAETEADLRALTRDGYVILEGLLDEEQCAEIKREAARLSANSGRNAFEGFSTQRVYNVLAKTRALDDLVDHPRVLALLDTLFMPNYLLSNMLTINIRPGEAAQFLHTDDGFYKLPRPRPPLGAATIFAIDPFTEENGATRLVPGSHTWGMGHMPEETQTIPCVMPAGSAVFFVGTLWHGGGANRSQADRLAATCQYCEPWLRQQENYTLGIPKEIARDLRESLKRMMGYSIHPPFMGMVDGMHPKRLLES